MALIIAALLEIMVGASFVLATNAQSQLIFGTKLDGPGLAFARFSGIALIALGIACIPSNVAGTRRTAARALLIFNIAVTIFFAWIAVATTFRGVVLWPVVIMHAVVAIALARSLRYELKSASVA